MTADSAEEVVRPAVMLVSVGAAYGGAETYYVKLAAMLRDRYSLCAVVCNRHLASELQAIGVDVEDVSPESSGYRRYLATAGAIWRIMSSLASTTSS